MYATATSGFHDPKIQTHYQMMNSYQTPAGLSPKNKSPSKADLPPHVPSITETPNYSAKASNKQFFKTIEESPFLGARGNTPIKASNPNNNKVRTSSLWATQDLRNKYSGVSAI